jgi:hypothetical protein
MVDSCREDVACSRSVKIVQILILVWRLEDILRSGANPVILSNPSSGEPGHSSRFSPSIEPWCNLLLPFGAKSIDLVTTLRLIVYILDLSVVSYTGAHLHNFVQEHLEQPESKIDIIAPFSESGGSAVESVVFRRCSFQFLDYFHRNTPVWVFAPSFWQYRRPLCISTDVETFSDI